MNIVDRLRQMVGTNTYQEFVLLESPWVHPIKIDANFSIYPSSL